MNNFEIEKKRCIDEEKMCAESQRTLAMELQKAIDIGNSLKEMTDHLYCILFGGEMAERNCCDPAQSVSDELDRLVGTLCRTCDLIKKILTMVG